MTKMGAAAAPGQPSAAPRPAPGCTRGSPAAEPTGAGAPAAAGSRSAGSEREPAGKANSALCQLPSHPHGLTSTPGPQPQLQGHFPPCQRCCSQLIFLCQPKNPNPGAAPATAISKCSRLENQFHWLTLLVRTSIRNRTFCFSKCEHQLYRPFSRVSVVCLCYFTGFLHQVHLCSATDTQVNAFLMPHPRNCQARNRRFVMLKAQSW